MRWGEVRNKESKQGQIHKLHQHHAIYQVFGLFGFQKPPQCIADPTWNLAACLHQRKDLYSWWFMTTQLKDYNIVKLEQKHLPPLPPTRKKKAWISVGLRLPWFQVAKKSNHLKISLPATSPLFGSISRPPLSAGVTRGPQNYYLSNLENDTFQGMLFFPQNAGPYFPEMTGLAALGSPFPSRIKRWQV